MVFVGGGVSTAAVTVTWAPINAKKCPPIPRSIVLLINDMKTILHIIASPGGTESHSFLLGDTLINQLPPAAVRKKLLYEDAPPPVSRAYIRAVYTHPSDRTAEQQDLVQYSDTIIRDVREADIVVIATPVHNFGIPALLKAWIDMLVRPGVTSGRGSCPFTGKKVYVAVVSGRQRNPDFIAPYLKAILAEVGLTDVAVLTLKGTAIKTMQQEDYEQVVSNI